MMDKFERLAERWSLPAVKALAFVHMVLFAWFVSILMATLNHAHAQAAPCVAEDVMPAIEAASPGAGERIRAEAAKIPNGKGLLWKIEKAGVEPSFLFGTMHLTDERVTRLSTSAQSAFDGAATVVVETTDVLDQARMAAAMAADPSLTMYVGQQSLRTVLTPDQLTELESALKTRGLALGAVMKMKPWMLSTMLAAPQCEATRVMAGLPFLDKRLALDAEASGKALIGLESGVEQLRAMDSVPVEFHVKGLIGIARIADQIDNVFETMIRLYVAGETGMFKPLFAETEAIAPGVAGGMEGYAAFEQIVVDKRNAIMVERALPVLEKGDVFVAVGALHLPGEKGLIEELRRRGYALTAQ